MISDELAAVARAGNGAMKLVPPPRARGRGAPPKVSKATLESRLARLEEAEEDDEDERAGTSSAARLRARLG